uniref:Uncharacterized protein n=1 Tax=Opuntia streptacantha TaxID=393608 RepID=A0A7C9E839_OPUST
MATMATTTGRSILSSFSSSNTSGARRSFSGATTKTAIRPNSFVFSTTNLGRVSHPLLRLRASAGPNPTDPSNPSTNNSDSSSEVSSFLSLFLYACVSVLIVSAILVSSRIPCSSGFFVVVKVNHERTSESLLFAVTIHGYASKWKNYCIF